MKVLIFNGNEKNRKLSAQLCKEIGFNTLVTGDEEQAIDYLKTETIDVVLIDSKSLKNTKKYIKEILKYRVKEYIVLLIDAKDKYSKVEALLDGVDDYIYNTYTMEELSAKLQAIMRVIIRFSQKDRSELLSVDDLTLNPLNREVKRAGKVISLTNKEFLLLEYLLRNKNRVLTRTMLSEKIWDIDFISESNIVDVYVNFLRVKIDKGHSKKIITTMRGVGYIIKDENVEN